MPTVNQIVTRNSVPWVHDANGNVLDDGRNTCAWDAEDRLIKVTSKTTGRVSEFRYDGLSRRVAILERATATATAVETRYLWCGSQICQARSAAGVLQARYFPQGEVNLVGGTLTPRYYARDHLGSVLQIVNAAGATIAEQRYGDYGSLTYSSGTAPTFGFAGMFQHSQSGLNLTWYRAYDAASARWISRDPIEESGGLNLYGYVGGAPNLLIDPFGLVWVTTGVDYHGAYNLSVALLNRVATIDEGTVANMQNCAGCTRDLIQEWKVDGSEHSCKASDPMSGATRRILQTFNEYDDNWQVSGRSWHWDPVVPNRTWDDY